MSLYYFLRFFVFFYKMRIHNYSGNEIKINNFTIGSEEIKNVSNPSTISFQGTTHNLSSQFFDAYIFGGAEKGNITTDQQSLAYIKDRVYLIDPHFCAYQIGNEGEGRACNRKIRIQDDIISIRETDGGNTARSHLCGYVWCILIILILSTVCVMTIFCHKNIRSKSSK